MGGSHKAGKKREWECTFWRQKWQDEVVLVRDVGWRTWPEAMLRSYAAVIWGVMGALMATNIGF